MWGNIPSAWAQAQVESQAEAAARAAAGIQSKQVQSTLRFDAESMSRVKGELVEGRLHPSKSKPRDEVVVKLTEDVKSEGQVLLKKGVKIAGIVEKVWTEAKAESQKEARSIIQLKWLAPGLEGQSDHSMTVVLQSVSHVSPLFKARREDEFAQRSSTRAGTPARDASGGDLLGSTVGTVGATAGAAVGAAGEVAGTAGDVAAGTTGSLSGDAVSALALPGVVRADTEMMSALQQDFDLSSEGHLFKVGQGQLVTATGGTESVELFSQFNNDSFLVSSGDGFEIRSGAQMQFLIAAGAR